MGIKEELKQSYKNKRYAELSEDKKKESKMLSVEEILKEVKDKNNRFIFYCPDIALVNPLLKIVYEVALAVKKAGYNVVMLHEMQGFKAHWLYDSEGFSEYRSIKVEYVMQKATAKTKKQKSSYSFRAADTLIVTDAYQEMLENIISEDALKLVQKIVLVTGYMGLASMTPGVDYNRLNVNSLVFFDKNIKEDYNILFQTKDYIVDDYQVVNRSNVAPTNVAPVIGITSIGNNDKANQLINVFYNKYPNLSMFTFKVIARDTMDVYLEDLSQIAGMVMLDKNVVTKQMVYECIVIGLPVFLPSRREFMDVKQLVENFVINDDVFDMADAIATFCNHWLNHSTGDTKEAVLTIAAELGLKDRTDVGFNSTVAAIFAELHGNRERTFNNLRKMIEAGE